MDKGFWNKKDLIFLPYVISVTRRTVYCTGGRTDHTDETDRRHEGIPDIGDSRDVGGENHGRASGPGSDGVLAMAAVE